VPTVVSGDVDSVQPHVFMRSGRMSNEILTNYLAYPADFPSQISGKALGAAYKSFSMQGGRTKFSTRCAPWQDGGRTNPSDSAMIVVVTDSAGNYVQTLISNDADQPIPGDASGKGSDVVHEGTDGRNYGYAIYLFSQNTSSSHCSLHLTNGNNTSSRDLLGGPKYFGGKLVQVGAVPRGDYFEVQTTPSPESAIGGTRMLLFRPWKQPVVSTYVNAANDFDAQLTVESDDFLGTDTLLLVGRNWVPGTAASAFPLVRADLVHGPSTGTSCPTPNCWSGTVSASSPGASEYSGQPVPLSPGRWIVGVELALEPAGSTATGVANSWTFCDAKAGICDFQHTHERGLLNDRVAQLSVEYGTSSDRSAWTSIATSGRRISRGAFGSSAPHRFYQEIDVREPGYYAPRIKIDSSAAVQLTDVSVGRTWFAQRNAEAGELRVASANMLYENPGEPDAIHAEYRNLADLLGPRGNIATDANSATIWPAYSDSVDRAPFQLNSDAIFMTEMGDNSGWPETFDRAKLQGGAFAAVANHNDSRSWSGLFARNEDTGGLGLGTEGVGAVYAARTVVGSGGLKPGVLVGKCWDDYEGHSDYYNCWIEGDGDGSGALPVSLRATTSHGQPILFIGVHLRTSGPTVRAGQVKDLANRILRFLDLQPGLANAHGEASGTGLFNRIVIVGDWNVRAHRGGETYPLLRILREKLGYALDVAIALSGSTEPWIATGMHVLGQRGCFHAETEIANEECTCGGQHGGHGMHHAGPPHKTFDAMTIWEKFEPTLAPQDQCNLNTALHLPWWAGTWRGKRANVLDGETTTTDRHDLIILAGRGWETDDPVRSYRVVQDANIPSNYFAPRKDSTCADSCSGRGVSLFPGAPGGPGDYAPRYSLLGHGSQAGSAALRTDHRPIGATLRIWSGHGARF